MKKLTTEQYESLQHFFYGAKQLERARLDLIESMENAWRDKSIVIHESVGRVIIQVANLRSEQVLQIENEIQNFRFQQLDFTPDVVNNLFRKNLDIIERISGESTYLKIYKMSYSKK